MTRIRHRQHGLSFTEVTMLFSVLSVMTAVLSPSISDYVQDARRVKATDDVQFLASRFARFALDVSVDPGLRDGWTSADLLVGPGNTPMVGDGGDVAWTEPVDGHRVSYLDDRVMMNAAGSRARDTGPRYVRADLRSSHLSGLTPDPWGHRYAINVRAMDGRRADTIVLSPGPNGLVETEFNADGLRPGGDDIIAVISGGR
jgi:type II secretory pathway pseudopilin PulG